MYVYDLAMKIENEGKAYYEKQVKDTNNEGIKRLFKMMADDEAKHYKVIEELKREASFSRDIEKNEKRDLDFTEQLEQFRGLVVDEDSREGLDHAVKLEKESIKFYKEKAEKSESETERNTFLMIEREERRHLGMLERIINHIPKS